MPASIFAGSKVKTLKDTLTLNGKSDIISSTVDPTASAVDAPIGSLLINQTSGKLYRKLDAGSSVNWEEVGSGTGGINYILNPSAEVNTTGWATYADAAGTVPVDGSGGSPTVTWTRSTTSPLRGVADFNFAKDAANRQGQGVSYDFTIDEADKAKVLTVTFDYEVLSGTYADGDLTVYLIADPVGTPVVIQPAGYTVLSATSGTTMRQRATFQTQATGTSYRLCFHVASTSTSAYTLAIDNVVVGPQPVISGVPASDWTDFTATLGGGTASSSFGKYRRIGDSMHINMHFVLSAGGAYTFAMPTGFTMDSNKIAGAAGVPFHGTVVYRDVSSNQSYLGSTYPIGSSSFGVQGPSAVGNWSATAPVAFGAGDTISVDVIVPITGWSSNTVMSNDTDTRVVAASYWRSANGAVASNSQIDFDSQAFDTSASVTTGASWKYTAPVSGFYKITSYMNASTALASVVNIYKNGTLFAPLGYTANFSTNTFSGSNIIKLNAGDYFDLRPTAAVTITGSAGQSSANASFIEVERLSGPATIAASETVVASFKSSVATSITTTGVVVPFATKEIDSHSAFLTDTYTIPVSGTYEIYAQLTLAASVTSNLRTDIQKNGTAIASLVVNNVSGGVASINLVAPVTKMASFIAGDTVKILGRASTNTNLIADANYVFFHIKRVGN